MQRIVQFGPFTVDLDTGELRRDGRVAQLQPQPLALLGMLLERPGALVTREDLRGRIWPGEVFLDFDHGLNKAVSKLRSALDDDTGVPPLIETFPKRGYRFNGTVNLVVGGEPRSGGTARLLVNGTTIPLPDGDHGLGRDESSTVRLQSAAVSRRHARITVSEGRAVLEDLGSKNGTRVNGTRLTGSIVLADGDRVEIGPTLLVFRIGAAFSTVTETKAGASCLPGGTTT